MIPQDSSQHPRWLSQRRAVPVSITVEGKPTLKSPLPASSSLSGIRLVLIQRDQGQN
jgi:hypothetical protein